MKDHRLGLFSGMGMVIANMIGAGVFLSTGFMAQDLTPKQILLAWAIGAFLALAGARAYAGIAQIVPKSGGEYRYLSTLVHPALGYLAGWASLLLGFSAPIAIDAIAAGAFANTLAHWINPKLFAALLIVLLTGVHAIGLRFSVNAQNVARHHQNSPGSRIRGRRLGRRTQCLAELAAAQPVCRLSSRALHAEPFLHRLCFQRVERCRVCGIGIQKSASAMCRGPWCWAADWLGFCIFS